MITKSQVQELLANIHRHVHSDDFSHQLKTLCESWLEKDAEIARLNGLLDEKTFEWSGAIQSMRGSQAQVRELTEALEKIRSFDSDPQNHHKDASKCSICIAREVLAKHGVRDVPKRHEDYDDQI